VEEPDRPAVFTRLNAITQQTKIPNHAETIIERRSVDPGSGTLENRNKPGI
jgi:hypothetical protein